MNSMVAQIGQFAQLNNLAPVQQASKSLHMINKAALPLGVGAALVSENPI